MLATTSATDHQLNDQFSLQAPVFMSFFFALKGMVNAPVESRAVRRTVLVFRFYSDHYYLLHTAFAN
jgi:hypothetical protein